MAGLGPDNREIIALENIDARRCVVLDLEGSAESTRSPARRKGRYSARLSRTSAPIRAESEHSRKQQTSDRGHRGDAVEIALLRHDVPSGATTTISLP